MDVPPRADFSPSNSLSIMMWMIVVVVVGGGGYRWLSVVNVRGGSDWMACDVGGTRLIRAPPTWKKTILESRLAQR